MANYLVKVEGASLEINEDNRPAWCFSVVRAVKAGSAAEAKVIAISKVAREWAARQGRSKGLHPRLKVIELHPASTFKAWWQGRGDFVFDSAAP